uniref:OSK domain-containing protein n=9 Tax=Neogobius melanostomus TaxID=47308 RepID=A0A8C6V045_9GOBI
MAEGGRQTSPCESCRMYQQEISLLRDKIYALETERGLNDTLPVEPGKKTEKTDTCNLKLNDTITFPKLNRQLGARPKQRQHARKNAPEIKLTNRFSPLSENVYNKQKMSEKNKEHEVKTKMERNTVPSVKARDTLLLGDGAISNINNEIMTTVTYPSATVSDIIDVLNKEITNNPGINKLVLHVGAVDTRNGESEVLKEKFNKLFERLDCLDKDAIQIFISGPIPNIDGRINKFSRLFQLNTWLSKVCKSRGLTFIENFNLFWKRDDLFKGNGPHLSRGGVRRLTENLLHALQNPWRPEQQERAERSMRRAPGSPAKVSPASPIKDSVAAASSAPTVKDSATAKDPATAAPAAPTVEDSATVKDPATVKESAAPENISTIAAAPPASASPGKSSASAPPASIVNDSAEGALSSTPPQALSPTGTSTPSRDFSESFPSPKSPMGFPSHFEALIKQGIQMTPRTPVM